MLEEPPAQLEQRGQHCQVRPLLQAVGQPDKTIKFLLDYQIMQLKPVEESDHLIPFTELRVLVASCVEHNLER